MVAENREPIVGGSFCWSHGSFDASHPDAGSEPDGKCVNRSIDLHVYDLFFR